MTLALQGNISSFPDPSDSKDRRIFTMGDGRTGIIFNVAMGSGPAYLSVKVFDRNNLEEGQAPDRNNHHASWLLDHVGVGSAVNGTCRITGNHIEKKTGGGRWGRTGGGGKTYNGESYIPIGTLNVGLHSGEGRILTSMRRNMDNPTIKAALDFLTAAPEDLTSERIGDSIGVPGAWTALNEMELHYGNANSKAPTPTSAVDGASNDSDDSGDPSEDDEEIPF